MRRGRLIAVVGPSGVGKDTVMAAMVASVPGLASVRRVISRPSAAGGEDFEGVDLASFEQMEAKGHFGLSWRAHDLAYGIPKDVSDALERGEDRLVNLSRGVLSEAAAHYAPFLVLSLTARPEILAQRLSARGRETPDAISARLARQKTIPSGLDVVEIDNSGALESTVRAAIAALYPESATRCS